MDKTYLNGHTLAEGAECLFCGASGAALAQRCPLPKPLMITDTAETKNPGMEKRKKPNIAPDYLEAAAATFRERNAIYGNNYQRFGALLLALFPEGGIPAIATEHDAQRLDYIIMCLGKLQRYAHNFSRGGHRDSAHDLQVYAAMLEEFTE